MIKFEFITFNPFSDEVDNYDVIGVRAHLDEGETVTFGRDTFTKDFFMGIEFTGVKRIDDVVDEDTLVAHPAFDINFDLVVEDSKFGKNTVGSVAMMYDNRFCLSTIISQLYIDILPEAFTYILGDKYNIKDLVDPDMESFIKDDKNRRYIARCASKAMTSAVHVVDMHIDPFDIDAILKVDPTRCTQTFKPMIDEK